jgi:broad specificity phosphatase PhoE
VEARDDPAGRICRGSTDAVRRAVVAHEPHAANSWLRDPAASPHGGEPILDLMRRVAIWIAEQQARNQRSITVTHSTIIRLYERLSFM